jgi:hypothetical protein
MNSILSSFSSLPFRAARRAAFAAAAALLTTGLGLAQQRVCMSLHAGPATGTNSLGAPAQVAGRVNGVQVSVPTAAGMTPAAASAAHQAAFAAAGFTTVRVGPLEFCVIAGPGGAPITSGLCYGTDDMGLDLDSSVGLIPPPAGGVADPVTKPGGAVVPVPPSQQPPLPWSGRILVCFWVRVNGTRTLVCFWLQLQPNLPGSVLQQLIEQQLLQNGFVPNRIQMRDPMNPSVFIEAIQVDRTVAGAVVDGVEYQYDAMSRRVMRNYTGAGLWPEFGTAEYGLATRGLSPIDPWSHSSPRPAIGSFFDIFHEVGLPNHPGGILFGFGTAALPLLNGILLIDPALLSFEFQMSDANGRVSRGWNVPSDPVLVGVPLHEQGGVMHAGGQLTLSTGIRAVIGA